MTHFIVRVYKVRVATGVRPVRRVEILLSVMVVTTTKFVKKRDSTNITRVIVVKIAEIMTSCTIIGKHGGATTIIGSPSLALPKGRERRPIIYYVLCHYLHHLEDGIGLSPEKPQIFLCLLGMVNSRFKEIHTTSNAYG